jgi:hypothetical protein
VIDQGEALLALESDSVFLRLILSNAYARTGEIDRGIALGESAAAEFGTDAVLADVFVLAGQNERARTIVTDEAKTEWWRSTASAAVLLGDEDLALDILEQREKEAKSERWDFRCEPDIRSLAGNPRYDALLERLDLPN